MSDVDQKIEQAKIIMNENVAGNVDPEEFKGGETMRVKVRSV